jgi:hypothetical protein
MNPDPRPGCIVTIGLAHDGRGRGWTRPTCGLPVVRHQLCEWHLKERARLGGKPA